MTATYLPAPIKVQNNHINQDPNYSLYAGSSIALGILSYYSPKTFIATAVGIFAYQVYHFNQLVQTADATKHQQIHTWAIKACQVMFSIGTVFMIKSLPSFWSAAKDLRHFQLIYCIGHLAKGAMMMLVAICTKDFSVGARDLAKCHRWVEMEDYVENYPKKVKEEILSTYAKQFAFYISALLPRTRPARILSRVYFAFSQFQPENIKFSILQAYFKGIDMNKWPLAIHQFQQLSIENQKTFGPQLRSVAQDHSEDFRDQLPDDVQAIILNETLKGFNIVDNVNLHEWKAFADAFEKLPREQQSILGEELFRKAQKPQKFSEPMRLAVLKASDKFHNDEGIESLVESIFNELSDPFKEEYQVFQEKEKALKKPTQADLEQLG